jgi:toxin ParE1/3/4
MLPVVRTDEAESDLVEILDYLDRQNPVAARKLARAIDAKCALLAELPELGRTREELGAGVRSVVVGRHVLFYRITPDAVEVLRILHGARDIRSIMKPDDD